MIEKSDGIINRKFSEVEIAKIKQSIEGKIVPFYFVPSAKLLEMCALNQHPWVQALGKSRDIFLKGDTYLLHQDMIVKYLEGTLDERNTWLLSMGDIRVYGVTDPIVKKEKNNDK